MESLQPTVGPQFLLESAGALTNAAGEVITGTRSIKGSHTGGQPYDSKRVKRAEGLLDEDLR